jgi:hypothetical protein
MSLCPRIFQITLLAASVAFAPSMFAQSAPSAEPTRAAAAPAIVTQPPAETQNAAELLEDSREAGLLTDWHLDGRFGHGRAQDFARQFSPEREAAKAARQADTHFDSHRYDLEFADGIFTLASQMANQDGVFYADSSTYLGDGEWNVYLESGAQAVVFVDGKRVIERGAQANGVLRATIHATSGYHSVLVKFVAAAAPFRVAILPPNSGSRRKNNTPYLKASPASEDMMAQAHRDSTPAAGN